MNSHMLGDWADGRWSPGFKASLQNKLNLCLFLKKKNHICNIFKYQKMLYLLYVYHVYIHHIYRSEGWRYSSMTEYMSSMLKVLVNLSIYNPYVSEEKCWRLT